MRTLAEAANASPLIRKLRMLALLQDEHVRVLKELQARKARYRRLDDLIRTGENYSHIYVLQSGWAMRSKLLADGRRQVINFDLPGDFLCLNACVMRRARYTITFLRDATVSVIEVPTFLHMIETYPSLGAVIQWTSAQEKWYVIEHLVSLGRRSAYERLAHVLLDLCIRLRLLGLVEDTRFYMPVTQGVLADLLGLSAVHVCRTFHQLQADGMLRTRIYGRGMEVEFLAYEALCKAVGFEMDFCYLTEISPEARLRIEVPRGAVTASLHPR